MADISSSSSDRDHDNTTIPNPAAPATTTRSTPTPSPSPTTPARAPASALAASAVIPQKRPYEDVAYPSPKRHVGPTIPPKPMLKLKPPREKKDSWKKKEAAAAAVAVTSGGAGGTGTVTAVDGGINTMASILQELSHPGLQRWRLPKPQDADYEGARPPLVIPSNLPGADINCEFVSLSEQCVLSSFLSPLSLSLSL